MHTLFGIIFWNSCAWLNMFCALLNAARFEGQWVWLSFYISFYKDGTPPVPPCVHQCLYHICTHRGRAGLINLLTYYALINTKYKSVEWFLREKIWTLGKLSQKFVGPLFQNLTFWSCFFSWCWASESIYCMNINLSLAIHICFKVFKACSRGEGLL